MISRLANRGFFPERDVITGVTNNFTYKITAPPVNKAVSLDTVKQYLRISASDTTQDDILNLIIDICTKFAENYTKRDFITRTSITFRDFFAPEFQIRRSPLQTVNKIERLVDGVLTLVDATLFSVTSEEAFSRIFLLEDKCWPDDQDNVPQAIKIEFVSGFGDSDTDIPAELRGGLLQHIANFFANRGDCSCDSAGAASALPPQAQAAFDQFKILDIAVLPRIS